MDTPYSSGAPAEGATVPPDQPTDNDLTMTSLPTRGQQQLQGKPSGSLHNEVIHSRPVTVGQLEGETVAALKADDAQINTAVWDRQVWALGLHTCQTYEAFHDWQAKRGRADHKCPLEVLRNALLRIWRKRVLRCLVSYMSVAYGQDWMQPPAAQADCRIGRECLERCSGVDLWEWRGG